MFAFLSENLFGEGITETQLFDLRAAGADDSSCATAQEYLHLLEHAGKMCCGITDTVVPHTCTRESEVKRREYYKDLPGTLHVPFAWGQCRTQQVAMSSVLSSGASLEQLAEGATANITSTTQNTFFFALTAFQRMNSESDAATCSAGLVPNPQQCESSEAGAQCTEALNVLFDSCYGEDKDVPQGLQPWFYRFTQSELFPLYHACTMQTATGDRTLSTTFALDTWKPMSTSFKSNSTRREAALKALQDEIGAMNTIPPSCYVDLFMPWAPSELTLKAPRRTLGGDNAANRLRL